MLAKQEMDTAALRQGHCPTVDVLVGYLLAQTQHPTRVQEAKEVKLLYNFLLVSPFPLPSLVTGLHISLKNCRFI